MFLKILNETFLEHENLYDEKVSRLGFLNREVFGFTTYDTKYANKFTKIALEICEAITFKKTFEYIEGGWTNYQWYLIMVNMPFFKHLISWGTSIRGAWWEVNQPFKVLGCNFYFNGKYIGEIQINNTDEWVLFIKAVLNFAQK